MSRVHLKKDYDFMVVTLLTCEAGKLFEFNRIPKLTN